MDLIQFLIDFCEFIDCVVHVSTGIHPLDMAINPTSLSRPHSCKLDERRPQTPPR